MCTMSFLRNHLLLPPNGQLYHQSSQPDQANPIEPTSGIVANMRQSLVERTIKLKNKPCK